MPILLKRKILPLLLVLALCTTAAFYRTSDVNAGSSEDGSLATVTVKPAAEETVTDWEEYTGRLEAPERVEVRSRVAGTIAAVHFKDGEQVAQGQLLFSIDPAPFEIELQRMQAMLSQARDRVQFTRKELERGKRLVEVNAIARRDFDALQHDAQEARSSLQAAEAGVKRAELDLAYTKIVAPISGKISRAEITKGNLIKSGEDASPLALIVSQSPIYVSFNADERTYLRYYSNPKSAHDTSVRVGLIAEENYPHSGTLVSVDNQLDTRSGTLRMRALLPNTDGVMIPGLQARVRLQTGEPYRAVLIDEAVIGTDQDRRFVLVVDGQGQVERRILTLGSRQGTQRVVLQGLRAADLVIVDGAQRVQPGQKVKADVPPSPGVDEGVRD